LKFSNQNGAIKIRVTPEGTKYFRLEVEDTGIGIREEDLPKLFAEFQQLDASLNKKYQGTGLGLALTKSIAEAQNGSVGVKSVVNKGSTFYAILPKTPENIDQITAVEPTTKSIINNSENTSINNSNPLNDESIENIIISKETLRTANAGNVLVIEDDQKDSTLIVNTLTCAGYCVDMAYSGAEAIKICQEKEFDAITLDLLLPDMNGWDVLRDFRSKGLNLETPAIVLTVVASKAASFGFMIQNFLIKPIKAEDLISAIEKAGILKNQNKLILFVDDDPQMLMLCQKYLNDYGSTVICESNAEAALVVSAARNPDVIVLDLLMPGIDGLEFLRRFRLTPHGKSTPIIICTSQDISDVDRSRIKASVESVIQKGGGSMNNLVAELKRIFSKKD
jgi:CheY-like chemotaxis protein